MICHSLVHIVCSAPPVFVHRFIHFAPRFLFAFGLAAVPILFASRQGQFALGDALAKIDAQGNERQTFLLRFAVQALDLLLVQQQAAARKRLVVEGPAGQVFGMWQFTSQTLLPRTSA